MKRPSFYIVLVVILTVFFVRSRSSKDVDIAEVEKGSVVEELVLSGSIMADEHATLGFGFSGKI